MKRKIIFSGMAGNVLEIYDISIYGYFAQYFALNFFAHTNQTMALVKTFLIFLIGFLSRPIGAIIFGKIGDISGRRKALSISILLMAIATGLIAFLPTYQQVGVAAPLLLLFLKIIQGISVGAEYTGSIIFLSEHAPQKKKLYWSSFAVMAINCGTLLAGFFCYVIESHFSKESMGTVGWRIPYLIAFMGGLVAFYIRHNTDESDEFLKKENVSTPNHLNGALSNKTKMVAVIFLTFLGVTANYLFSVFMVTWMSVYLGYSLKNALLINNIGMVAVVISVLFFGKVIQEKQIIFWLVSSILIIMLGAIPYLFLIHMKAFLPALLAQIFMMIACACYFTVASYIIATIFPTRIRYFYSAIGYNFSAAIFGGATPMLCLYLLKVTGSYFSPGLYIIFVACSVIVFLLIFCIQNNFLENRILNTNVVHKTQGVL